MLNRITTYASNSKRYILDMLLRKKSNVSAAGLCCLSISPKELTLVYAREVGGKMTIELCESHSYDKKDSLFPMLSAIVKDNQLKNLACSLMLQPEDYQLLLTDALPVTATEFQAAIRWKIKDLIRFPMDDVVIDSFSMPKMKTSTNKIMVVAAQASKLKMLCEQIRDCGLEVKSIDIPELGLRNITILFEKEDNTIGLIYVEEKSIQLMIESQQQIYVSRQLKFSLNNEDTGTLMAGTERLAAEIQRSLDFYQSLWDQAIPSRFIFASTKLIGSEVIELLSQKIKIPVERINIGDSLVLKPDLNVDLQGKYLPVIGGALRESTKNAATD